MFDALLIEKTGERQSVSLASLDDDALPAGDVLVRVDWSTLNYKDALAITGRGPIVRQFPLVPGIDLAGEVVESADGRFRTGDRVLLNGYGVGERHWGGLAGRARVSADWLVPLPGAFDAKRAMALGTAGFTAMLCVDALERAGLTPDKGPVLVTGAAGGVGGIALMLLHRLGYAPVAMTGRPEEADYLRGLGASEIVGRDAFAMPGPPLGKARWAGAIDVAGGAVLAGICGTLMPRAAVAACGLAAGMDLPVTVAPFILRGISLLGIDSVSCPMPDRQRAWQRLAELVDTALLDGMTREIALADAIQAAGALLDGGVRGRLVVRTG
ncbi:MDR family oxidoreductase [Rhizosaccharibacter radicis]|uniref:Oxidoreductase n=1 Tax=Rhizosaccharibacter radicis TaxID=2782605 RepID=A0ABT1VTU2_9PROT|nr:oxidoreductase [Acetobacteraceae bacterium KSS12]